MNSQLVEVTKIRCAQCRQTIELGRRVGYLDPDWLSAEMEYREISVRILRRFDALAAVKIIKLFKMSRNQGAFLTFDYESCLVNLGFR